MLMLSVTSGSVHQMANISVDSSGIYVAQKSALCFGPGDTDRNGTRALVLLLYLRVIEYVLNVIHEYVMNMYYVNM